MIITKGGVHFSHVKYLLVCWYLATCHPNWGACGQEARERTSATFVTSLYDIGRESWPTYAVSFSSYLRRFRHLLALDINLVVYGDDTLRPFVLRHGKGVTSERDQKEPTSPERHEEYATSERDKKETTSSERHETEATSERDKIKMTSERERHTKTPDMTLPAGQTEFVARPFSQLPAHRHLLRMECVLDSTRFREDNEKLQHPEGFSADYLVLVLSKAALLGQVARRNPFNTTHFFWIDAGYAAVPDDDNDVIERTANPPTSGDQENQKDALKLTRHADLSDADDDDDAMGMTNPTALEDQEDEALRMTIPSGIRWRPEALLSVRDKVTYVQLHDPRRYVNVTALHKVRTSPALAGGFFGGAQKVVTYYDRLFNKQLLSQLSEGDLGEDQLVALQVYWEHPALFLLAQGDWFDAHRLFH